MSEQTELIEAGGMELMFRYLTPEDLPKLLDLYAEEQWGELSFCLLELLECYPESFLGAFGPDRELICKYNPSPLFTCLKRIGQGALMLHPMTQIILSLISIS